MNYVEPIATPGSHMEPDDKTYCEDCDEYGDACECREYYFEEMGDR